MPRHQSRPARQTVAGVGAGMSWGAAGFDHAPVSCAALLASAVSSVVSLAGRRGSPLDLGIRAGTRLTLHRCLVSHVVFSSVTECVFGYGLLYLFRVFERQRGSPKFLVHALTAVSFATALEVVATRLLLPRSVHGCASGLYAALFALLPLFWSDVPPAARFTVLGLPLTDKVFTYAVAAQLCICRGWSSVATCACGLAAGLLVAASGLDGDGPGSDAHHSALARAAVAVVASPWRLLAHALSAWGMFGDGTAEEATQPQRPTHRPAEHGAAAGAAGGHDGGGDMHLRRRHGAGATREAAAAAAAPSQEAVDMLCSMGFDAGAAHSALAACGGDVSVAANLLLSGSLD